MNARIFGYDDKLLGYEGTKNTQGILHQISTGTTVDIVSILNDNTNIWIGPNEGLNGWILCESVKDGNQPTPDGLNNGTVQFWRSEGKTETGFIYLINSTYNQTFPNSYTALPEILSYLILRLETFINCCWTNFTFSVLNSCEKFNNWWTLIKGDNIFSCDENNIINVTFNDPKDSYCIYTLNNFVDSSNNALLVELKTFYSTINLDYFIKNESDSSFHIRFTLTEFDSIGDGNSNFVEIYGVNAISGTLTINLSKGDYESGHTPRIKLICEYENNPVNFVEAQIFNVYYSNCINMI